MNILKLSAVSKSFSSSSVAVRGVDLMVREGELLALTGESGSGKTTLLRLIAGLEHPDRGKIEIESQIVATDNWSTPPQIRPVGFVFQDYALFPHMTVTQNILFGLSGLTEPNAKKRLEEVLKLVDLRGLGARYPHQLSGGQQQRVAIARALAPKPKVLLLDEPFSNLDTQLKDQVRQELKAILENSGATVILVTHDVQDALSMANRVAVLREGNLLQVGTPNELYQRPENAYTAAFFGKVNLIPVECREGKIISKIGTFFNPDANDKKGLWCLRPQQLGIVTDEQPGISGEVVAINFLGEFQQVRLKVGSYELWCHQPAHSRFAPGQQVKLSIDLNSLHIIQETPGGL